MSSHAQAHAPVPDAGDAVPGYYEIMETAVRELLVDKKVICAGEIRQMLEVMDTRTPSLGSKIVARAWVDPEFRVRLLADAFQSLAHNIGIRAARRAARPTPSRANEQRRHDYHEQQSAKHLHPLLSLRSSKGLASTSIQPARPL